MSGAYQPSESGRTLSPHFDGECDFCGCPRDWRTWGDCACGMCPNGCVPPTAPARVPSDNAPEEAP